MSNYRTEALINGETATTAGTKTVDIDLSETISRLVVQYKGTNNNAVPTAHGAKMVSLIELVDGSDILYSLSGVQAQALNFYEKGRMPVQINEYRNDVQNVQTFELNFGRWLWDTDFALDPNRFKNLQLRVTHNCANGGSTPDASTYGVFADLFDEKKPSPRGFLQARQLRTYTLVSSAVEPTDLPVDMPMRKLIVQSLSGGKQPWEQYNKLKLIEDGGRKTPINLLSTSDLLKLWNQEHYITEDFSGNGTASAVDHFVASTYDWKGVMTNFSAALTNNYLDQDYGGTQAVVGDSNEQFTCRGRGLAPHGAMQIPFGDQDDPNDWYMLNRLKSLKLEITAGSSVGSSSTCELIAQQNRAY